jgi:hypothetical protein
MYKASVASHLRVEASDLRVEASHLRVEVRHRDPAPRRYSWEIFRDGEILPVEEARDRFGSWEEASQVGKKALKKLLTT